MSVISGFLRVPSRQVLYSDSFRKQVQGKAAFVLDTPEMRRVRESQRNISSVSPLVVIGLRDGQWTLFNPPPPIDDDMTI